MNLLGGPLTEDDYKSLEARWIDRESADRALLRRVHSIDGAEIVGRENKSGNYGGILISYIWPGTGAVQTHRIRRDHPDLEAAKDGDFKEQRKYMGPPGRGNSLYFPPQVEAKFLDDITLPLVIVEGEFKTLALWRLAWYGLGDTADAPAFLPVGLQGVYSWRGKVGTTEDSEGHRQNIKGPVPDLSRIAWKGRKVIVLFDSNVESNGGIGAARWGLTRELEERGADVFYFRWPADLPATVNGIDDFLALRGPEDAIRQLRKIKKVTRRRKVPTVEAAIEEADWTRELIRGDKGVVKAILANAITYLSRCPELESMLAYDEFAVRVIAPKGTPWDPRPREWADVDDTKLTEWLQRANLHISVPPVQQAVEAVARERSFHPVRDYLASLVWDKKPRIDFWLRDYFGGTDGGYSRAVGSRWLISAIARVMKPGCQADHCLILQGQQGVGKSSALELMGGEWFTNQVGDITQKDSAQQLGGRWIVEFSELEQLLGLRAELAATKAFITRRVDRYRPPYDRRPADFPRQCVFSGSVNLGQFLRDETGARRFWPVQCGKVDLAGLERDRDMLWAEARARFERSDPWYLDTPNLLALAKEEADQRYENDPWETLVIDVVDQQLEKWTAGGFNPAEAFTIGCEDLLRLAIQKPAASWTQPDKYRIGRIMRAHGYEYVQVRLPSFADDPPESPDAGAKKSRHWIYRLVRRA